MFMNTIAHSKDFKKLSNLIEPTSNFVNREKEINLISESFKKSKKILSITGFVYRPGPIFKPRMSMSFVAI